METGTTKKCEIKAIRQLESTILLSLYSQQAKISNRIKMLAKELYLKEVKEKRAIGQIRPLKKQRNGHGRPKPF